MTIFRKLNEEQKEAVKTINGPLLIIAGAGSGKTRALTHRVGYLIQQNVPATNILALTFTNKAAEEMRVRLTKLLGLRIGKSRFKDPFSRLPFIGTFHALGAKILRAEMGLLGRANDFVIYDTKDQRSLVKEIMARRDIGPDRFGPGGVLAAISKQKNELVDAEEYTQEKANSFFEKIVAEVYTDYENMLVSANAVDFDDLLVLTSRLFNNFPRVLEKYQRLFTHILVDEYQDTNHAQYVLLRMLAAKHKNLCVVGDDWQSIYGFRGADFRNILNFEKDYPEAKIVMLEENYRSTQNILNAAQAVIEKNILRTNKKLRTQNPQGQGIKTIQVEDETEEGVFVTSEIERLMGSKNPLVKSLNEIVVLYRTNAQSRVLEEALIDSGLPYKIIGSVRFYERREIKDIIAYLRLIQNPQDAFSLKRIANVPPRGIGKVSLGQIVSLKQATRTDQGIHGKNNKKITDFLTLIQTLRSGAAKDTLSNLIARIIKKTNYERYINDGTPEGESRWENIQELIGVAKKFDHLPVKEALRLFLEEVALLTPADEVDTRHNLINLMTLHSVKGLEFPVVFITGCEEGLLPHAKAVLDPSELEEERRLCYVGLTRAKQLVYLVFAKRRSLFGSTQVNLPSRFLGDIPSELIDFQLFEEGVIDIDDT